MGLYLKFLGIFIMLSGLLLGGLTVYPLPGHSGFEQKLAPLNEKYEKIGKDLDAIMSNQLEELLIFRDDKFQKIKGIALVMSGIIVGSLFLGLGEVIRLLKKISRQ
ncbi:MAG: hypothetical protein JXD19_06675 [Deltaproteobacteria bacterium]|nr:hypothetical protein [Deltaproteobacteria bacterium]